MSVSLNLSSRLEAFPLKIETSLSRVSCSVDSPGKGAGNNLTKEFGYSFTVDIRSVYIADPRSDFSSAVLKTETCLCDLPGHFGIDGFEEAFVGGVSHICIVKSGKIGALEHTFHCVEIKALDAGKMLSNSLAGWLRS